MNQTAMFKDLPIPDAHSEAEYPPTAGRSMQAIYGIATDKDLLKALTFAEPFLLKHRHGRTALEGIYGILTIAKRWQRWASEETKPLG